MDVASFTEELERILLTAARYDLATHKEVLEVLKYYVQVLDRPTWERWKNNDRQF